MPESSFWGFDRFWIWRVFISFGGFYDKKIREGKNYTYIFNRIGKDCSAKLAITDRIDLIMTQRDAKVQRGAKGIVDDDTLSYI